MLSDWVVVVDNDSFSQQQKNICRELKPDLQGMIDCNDIDNTNTVTCRKVLNFPAFCHLPTDSCVYGVRDTLEALNKLPTLVTKEDPAQENQPS
jgi:hypothetical protein